MKEKKILLFHISEKKAEEISALCRDLQIETVRIEKSRYYEFLGTLAGIPGLKGPCACIPRRRAFGRDADVFRTGFRRT